MTDQDHNLLIELNVKVERLISDVKDVKENTTKRVDALEVMKFDKDEAYRLKRDGDVIHENLAKRVTWLERIAYGALAIIGFIEFYSRVL